MCQKKTSESYPIQYRRLSTFLFGSLQILTATSAVLISSSIWWFTVIVGITGIATFILGIKPDFKLISLTVFILSIMSLFTSVSVLIYIQKWIKEDKYTILVITGVLQCYLSISCLILLGHVRHCFCRDKVHPDNEDETQLLLPFTQAEPQNPVFEGPRLTLNPYLQIKPINIPCLRTPEEDFLNHYDAFPQFANHSR